MGLLSLAIWTPILFGVVLLALGRDDQAQAVRWIALIGALVSLLNCRHGSRDSVSTTTSESMVFLFGLSC